MTSVLGPPPSGGNYNVNKQHLMLLQKGSSTSQLPSHNAKHFMPLQKANSTTSLPPFHSSQASLGQVINEYLPQRAASLHGHQSRSLAELEEFGRQQRGIAGLARHSTPHLTVARNSYSISYSGSHSIPTPPKFWPLAEGDVGGSGGGGSGSGGGGGGMNNAAEMTVAEEEVAKFAMHASSAAGALASQHQPEEGGGGSSSSSKGGKKKKGMVASMWKHMKKMVQ